jgi:ribosomal protein S18 acetylase RimI-like enzyme
VERGLLKDLARLTRDNMITTYLGLARTVPTFQLLKETPYVLVSGPSDLSFCNFAAQFDLTKDLDSELQQLAQYGETVPGLWAFVISSDKPEDLVDRIQEVGFERRQYLVQMVWQGSAPTLSAWPEPVLRPEDRERVAHFMADTFFLRTSAEGKKRIAAATSVSPHQLQAFWKEGSPVAAVMTVETSGILGLYNLCTKESERGEGYGRALVRQVQAQAASNGLPVCLQCHVELQGWYQDLGFRPVGEVEAFTFVGTFPFF